MTDDRRKQKGGAEKRREKLTNEAKNKEVNDQMRALMAQCMKKPAARRLSGEEETVSKQPAFASGGDEAPQCRLYRGPEDLQQRTSPPEYSTLDEASNEEEQNLPCPRVLKGLTKPARGSKFNYAWYEKFAWLYYDEEKVKPSASTE